MMYEEYDKENYSDNHRNVHYQRNNGLKGAAEKGFFQKKENLKSKSAIAGRFGQLLTKATNEIREEEDTLYAIDQQAEEAVTVLSEWIQESEDLKLAQALDKALEEEHDCQKRLEIIQGEAEALRIAVEEKRRIKAEAQSKTEQEKADEEFARKLAADEVKYFEEKKRQFEDDEKYSYDLEQEERRMYGESKAETKEDLTDVSSVADSKGDYDEKEDYKDRYEEKSSTAFDYKEEVSATPISPRSSKRAVRSKLQRKQFNDLPDHHPYKKYDFHVMKDEAIISKLWEKGTAEISELTEALCISIQLPNIQRLHVGMEKDGKLMKISAKRFLRKISPSSPSFGNTFSKDSTQYTAEFLLDGDVTVTTRDIYHEYYQESGMLFIYVENICLDQSNASNSSVLSKGKQALSSFKNNFLRIFGGK